MNGPVSGPAAVARTVRRIVSRARWRQRPDARVALDRLAQALAREGWRTAVHDHHGSPSLRVTASAVPDFGETITVVADPATGGPCYLSSTDSIVGSCSDPARAARQVTARLGPWIAAALAGQARRRNTASDLPPMTPGQFRRRFPDLPCWWGDATRSWWAATPRGLVSAATLEELCREIGRRGLE
ncbi:hypothetical protein [Actinomadura parmotrematis]|uniref:SUKH-3 domain containing protein n=1 Tax=Actinomadura parmotrematis TaxID=2864039 RepID=A0ABS7FV49_9ACTN|nr:hypothetical protein [Actinomadura parmotrematis]MBW8483462.1 hypothetical protein [Actinomadura parmotrematis]